MSRTKHSSAFAVASDGTVLLNVALVNRRWSPVQLLIWAQRERGLVFIGVRLSAAEAKRLLKMCRYQHEEAVSYVIGGREKQRLHKRIARTKTRS